MKLSITNPIIKNTMAITGIVLLGAMAATSWYHHSLRVTMRYEHELWKDSQQPDCNDETGDVKL
jgi:hypothetical protein